MDNRKLDALAAEHVMGWKIHARNTACYVAAAEQNGVMVTVAASHTWSPTTNPIACEELLDKMSWHGWYVVIAKMYMDWACVFRKEEDSEPFEGRNYDRKVAIVMAALRAHGVEIR